MEELLADHHQLMRYFEEKTSSETKAQESALRCEIDLTGYTEVDDLQFNQVFDETQRMLRSTIDATENSVSIATVQQETSDSPTETLGNIDRENEDSLQLFQTQRLQEKVEELIIKQNNDKELLAQCENQLEEFADQLICEQEKNAALSRENASIERKLATVRAQSEVQARQDAVTIKALESGKYGDKFAAKIASLQTELSVAENELERAKQDEELREDTIYKPLSSLKAELAQTRRSLTGQIRVLEDRCKSEIIQIQTVVQLVSERSSREEAEEEANSLLLHSLKSDNSKLAGSAKELQSINGELVAENERLKARCSEVERQLMGLTEKQRQINQECVKSQDNIMRMKGEYERVVAEARKLKTAYDGLKAKMKEPVSNALDSVTHMML